MLGTKYFSAEQLTIAVDWWACTIIEAPGNKELLTPQQATQLRIELGKTIECEAVKKSIAIDAEKNGMKSEIIRQGLSRTILVDCALSPGALLTRVLKRSGIDELKLPAETKMYLYPNATILLITQGQFRWLTKELAPLGKDQEVINEMLNKNLITLRASNPRLLAKHGLLCCLHNTQKQSITHRGKMTTPSKDWDQLQWEIKCTRARHALIFQSKEYRELNQLRLVDGEQRVDVQTRDVIITFLLAKGLFSQQNSIAAATREENAAWILLGVCDNLLDRLITYLGLDKLELAAIPESSRSR